MIAFAKHWVRIINAHSHILNFTVLMSITTPFPVCVHVGDDKLGPHLSTTIIVVVVIITNTVFVNIIVVL